MVPQSLERRSQHPPLPPRPRRIVIADDVPKDRAGAVVEEIPCRCQVWCRVAESQAAEVDHGGQSAPFANQVPWLDVAVDPHWGARPREALPRLAPHPCNGRLVDLVQ